ncbi:hypothetical protein HMPREF3121_00620 [Corynebacterium sp. HMSC11E11]|nr:hypothetical protein HMPREF3121_00620 [Corynebacterium sp. HMSC11E11]
MPSIGSQLADVTLLGRGELRLPTFELALSSRDRHALFCACRNEIRFEFRNHGQRRERELADRIGGIVDGTAEAQGDFAAGEFGGDGGGVGDGAGKPIELCHDESVAGTTGGDSLAKSGTVAVAAAESAVGVYPTVVDAEGQ